MTVYVIALTEGSDEAWGKLEAEFRGRHCMISDTMAFVAPEGIATAGDVAKRVGIDLAAEAASGLVIQLVAGQLWGALPTNAIDWLEAAEDE